MKKSVELSLLGAGQTKLTRCNHFIKDFLIV